MPSKMTAAVLYGSEDLRVEQIDVPAIAVDEVLLRVRLALTDCLVDNGCMRVITTR